MTSAKSSLPNSNRRLLNPQIQMMKHRLWVIAFTVMGAIAYYVIGGLLYLSRQKQYIADLMQNMRTMGDTVATAPGMADYVRHFYGFCSLAFPIVAVLAIVMGLEGFAYIHKMQTMDFFESQPLKRSARFVRIYWNGFRIFLSIWTLATGVGIAIGAMYGGMSGPVLVEILLEFLRLIILFFGVYNISILAAAISKNAVVSALMTAILLGTEAAYRGFVEELRQAYFSTYYYYSGLSMFQKAKVWLTSPLANYLSGREVAAELQRTAVTDWKMLWSCLHGFWYTEVASLVIGCVFLLLAYAAFSHRKTESVGQGLVYRWMEGATKLLIAIPLGAVCGLIMDATFNQVYKRIGVLTVVMIILVIVCFSMITECICNGSIKACFKRAWQIPVALVLSFAFFLVFRMDIFGYDRYVPKESQIRDAVFFDSSNQQYYADYRMYSYYDPFGFYAGGDMSVDNYMEENMRLTDIDAAIQIARLGMKERSEEMHSDNLSGSYNAVIMFHMKDGSLVARNISIPKDVDEELMNRLVGSDEYRSAVYRLDTIRDAVAFDAAHFHAEYNYGLGSNEIDSKESVINGLLDAYEKDLRSLNFSKLKNKHAIGSLSIYTENEYSLSVAYPVYADFANTIAFLEEQSVYHSSEIPTEILTQVNIYGGFQDGDTYYSGDLYYSEPEIMEKLASKAYPDCEHDWKPYGGEAYLAVSLYGDYGD
ncbi:MAG: hypothetical protein J6Z06_02815, partial [Lachnospiraceae bacterium]|nr:hypothetical protein [Lachnospiraceae bacterium]